MKRISLAEKFLWYLAAFAVGAAGGCAAMDRAFTSGPDGKVPAQTTAESIGAAVSTVNPAVGGVLVAAGGLVGLIFGRKTAPASTPPADPAKPAV